MTYAHHFIDISQNILNLWMRLIFPEPRHPGLQFEYKNKTIPIRIELDILFEVGSTSCLACSSFPLIFPFNAPDFS